MVLVNKLWCGAARRACCQDQFPIDEYLRLVASVDAWRASLSPRLRYSDACLQGHLNRKHDMPFIFINLVGLGTDVLLRRVFLPSFAASFSNQLDPHRLAWQTAISEMYDSAFEILKIAATYSSMGGKTHFTPLMGFTVFLAGSMLSYLLHRPWFSPAHAEHALPLIHDALGILHDLCPLWAMASDWETSLRQVVEMNPQKDRKAEHHSALSVLTDLALSSVPITPPSDPLEAYSPSAPMISGLDLAFGDFADLFAFSQGTPLDPW
ncbi:hypothetical protein RQP46_011139 [Phenoliferia psychrophenolica]